MVDKNLTEIVVVLDRSGSMNRICEDMKEGFMSFLEQQKKGPGKCVVTLARFDDSYELVYEEKDINLIHGLELVPRGTTALRDAVGKTIISVGERLAKKPENIRPGCVIFLIITDGHENASREWSNDQVRKHIQLQEGTYSWKFVYLGSDAGTFNDAKDMGFSVKLMGLYDSGSAMGVNAMYNAASSYTIGLRNARNLNDVFAESSLSIAGEGITTVDSASTGSDSSVNGR